MQTTCFTFQFPSQSLWLFVYIYYVFKNIYVFLAASWDGFLVAAGRIGTWALYLRCLGSVVGAHGLSCPVACGILVPQLGIEPASLTLEGRFVTTGLRSVKSPCAWVWNEVYLCCPHLLLPSCIHRSVLGFGTWGLRAWSVPRAWSSSKALGQASRLLKQRWRPGWGWRVAEGLELPGRVFLGHWEPQAHHIFSEISVYHVSFPHTCSQCRKSLRWIIKLIHLISLVNTLIRRLIESPWLR